MEKYYFTFGSWKRFPYQNTYLIIIASGFDDAVSSFRERYPDIHKGCLNCSFWYDSNQWKTVGESYKGMKPAEIIWTETCFGNKPSGYDDLFIFVSESKQIIRIAEGTGDNLLPEDINNGFIDYIYYEQYELSDNMPVVDGGQVMLKEMFRKKYRCTADCIPEILGMAYGNNMMDCTILS